MQMRENCGALTKPPEASRSNTSAQGTHGALTRARGGRAKSTRGKIAETCGKLRNAKKKMRKMRKSADLNPRPPCLRPVRLAHNCGRRPLWGAFRGGGGEGLWANLSDPKRALRAPGLPLFGGARLRRTAHTRRPRRRRAGHTPPPAVLLVRMDVKAPRPATRHRVRAGVLCLGALWGGRGGWSLRTAHSCTACWLWGWVGGGGREALEGRGPQRCLQKR